MFKNNMKLQPIIIEKCEIKPANHISKNIVVSGKNYYNPKFENPEIKYMDLYFRIKYRKTKGAVARDKIPLPELLESTGFYQDNLLNLETVIDHAICVCIEYCIDYNKYIVHFVVGTEEDPIEGYLVLRNPNVKKQSEIELSKYETKLVKYLKPLLDI